MGKQINYYMEYEPFLKIAQAALDSGCVIVKGYDGKITGTDISIVTADCNHYFFHLPEAGKLEYKTYDNGRTVVDYSYTSSGNTLIEAGFSLIDDNDKRISRNRLFCISGYYDENAEWIPRPDCITKLYNKLVRIVKKEAPYDKIRKEYASPLCLELRRENNYKLL